MALRHSMNCVVGLGAGIVISLGASIQGFAQTTRSGSIFGTAADSTGRFLADVQLDVEDINRSTRTSPQGWFRIDSVEEGTHLLVARRLGFQPIVLSIRVLANDITYADVILRPNMHSLAPVTVRAAVSSAATSTGFDGRMGTGQGTYFTSADIEKIGPSKISNLLRRVPALRVSANGEVFSSRGKVSLLSKACANGLPVYVDNVFFGGGSSDDPSTLSDGFFGKGSGQNPVVRSAIDLVDPTRIAGIEIYSGPATVPANIAGANSSCGAILIWTKQK
jgi:hypothetical protein